MTIAEYFEAITDRFLMASFVTDFKILKQVDRSKNGHMRARATFSDNAPHFPDLDSFPHHIHVGEGEAIPGGPINIFGVLSEIEKTMKK